MAKVIQTVAWTMKDDAVIKLKESNTAYDVDEKVDAFLKGKNLYDELDGKKVEVEIDEEKGHNGTIMRLTLADGKKEEPKAEEPKETPKEEPKQQEKAEPVKDELIIKELTVAGVSVKNAGVTFKEEEKVWYTLDSTINAQEFKDKYTKKVVEVSILKTDKGNDVIKGYTVKEDDVKSEDETTEPDEPSMTQKDAFYRVKQLESQVRYLKEQQSASFEAQSAVNSANQAITGCIEDDIDKVLVKLEKIATKNYEMIQKLKNKE